MKNYTQYKEENNLHQSLSDSVVEDMLKNNWKEEFKKEFGIHFKSSGELQFALCFIESLLAEQKKELMEEERQFILNVLDGIDTADKQMGVIGGTQAIRQALQSRVI